LRARIADFELSGKWEGSDSRWSARPPRRLQPDGAVVVTELSVDADGWPALCERLARLVAVPGGVLLEALEVGPDPEGAGVYLVTEAARIAPAPAGPGEAAALVATAARALHAMHESGLARGGLRPEELLSTARGVVLDLPRLDAAPGEVVRVTSWHDLCGLDPEVLAGGAPSRSSDIWSLGALLHSRLSARPLYPGIEGDATVTALQRVLFHAPEPDPAIPSSLAEIISECLRPDPADRPSSALEVAERVEAAGRGES
jgi:serine/threonine protein kinase